ncbi:glycosyltransferase family 4 protein [Kaistella sp.]|uniref:glycosyltransferase family 4 protein n=1 Tax=Kaistella sp. TaxID=2782235 RepID=UPI002F9358F3
MKKLLYVIGSLENSGGSERALTGRVNYLVENYDYDITIVTTNKNSLKSYYPINPKVKLVNIPISFAKNTLAEKLEYIFFNSHKEEKELYEYINEHKFDICSSLGAESFLYKGNNGHSFYKIKENRFTYKKLLRDNVRSIGKKIWRYFRFRNAVMVQKKMDCSVTLTKEDADFWSKYLKKIVVMPNFIDTENIESSELENKIVIAVGRLEVEKDFESLIESYFLVAHKYPEWKLHIYGDGSLKSKLQDLINEKKLTDKVILKGSVKNIYEQYLHSSIYVHTAVYEGFGLTILEAMAHKLPVVAFESVGGVKVLVKDNENGFLIKNRDRVLLAEKIGKLISDNELRNAMGAKSQTIAHEYSVENIMEKWHQFYSTI